MQALRAFWAKSFLNKLVLLVVLPLFCCGGYVATVQPGRNTVAIVAVTATPTDGPSPTPGPTDTPEPSVTPEPSATPEPPTVTPEPLGGLGVDRDTLRQPFSSFGFRFSESPLADGTSRLLGKGPNNSSIELVGPVDGGLTTVGLLLGLPTGSEEALSAAGTYMGTVVGLVERDNVQAITDWTVAQLQATVRGEDVTGQTFETSRTRTTITTLPADDGILLSWSIKPLT